MRVVIAAWPGPLCKEKPNGALLATAVPALSCPPTSTWCWSELHRIENSSKVFFNQKFSGHSPLHTWVGRKTKGKGNSSWLQHEETYERALITLQSAKDFHSPNSDGYDFHQFPSPSILALPFLHHDVVGRRRQGHHNGNKPLSTLHRTGNHAGCLKARLRGLYRNQVIDTCDRKIFV